MKDFEGTNVWSKSKTQNDRYHMGHSMGFKLATLLFLPLILVQNILVYQAFRVRARPYSKRSIDVS